MCDQDLGPREPQGGQPSTEAQPGTGTRAQMQREPPEVRVRRARGVNVFTSTFPPGPGARQEGWLLLDPEQTQACCVCPMPRAARPHASAATYVHEPRVITGTHL